MGYPVGRRGIAGRPAIFIRVSWDSNMLRRHFLPAADAAHARVASSLCRLVVTGGSGHLPRRPLPDRNLVTVGQVDRRIEDDLVPVFYPRAKLDGRAEVA
jgi:hypothetical protein